jgi:hypothetical protein
MGGTSVSSLATVARRQRTRRWSKALKPAALQNQPPPGSTATEIPGEAGGERTGARSHPPRFGAWAAAWRRRGGSPRRIGASSPSARLQRCTPLGASRTHALRGVPITPFGEWSPALRARLAARAARVESARQRHEGNGRSDAVRLLARGTLRRVRDHIAGRAPRCPWLLRKRAGTGREKRDEPQGRKRGATNPQPLCGASRRGGEKPRGRNEVGGWNHQPEGRRLTAHAREWTHRWETAKRHQAGKTTRGGAQARFAGSWWVSAKPRALWR